MHFIQQPDRVARRESDVSAADWRYQTHLSKYRGVRVWVDLSKQERTVCFILMLSCTVNTLRWIPRKFPPVEDQSLASFAEIMSQFLPLIAPARFRPPKRHSRGPRA